MSSTHNLPTTWQLLVQPQPVARPIVGKEFFRLPAWRRSIVSIAYCARCLEHWIAPQGWVREWLRLNVLAVVLLGTSVLLLGPVITVFLVSLFDWTNLSVLILVKLMSMVAVLPPFLLAVVTGIFLWKAVGRRKRQHRPHSSQQFYE